MPEQNQPIQGPFGASYSAALPQLQEAQDRVAQYQQQNTQFFFRMMQEKAQQRARENAMFDRIQNSEVGKVSAIDEPEVANAYSQWGQAASAADNSMSANTTELTNLHSKANQAFANAAKIAQESAQQKNNLDGIRNGMRNTRNRALYSDDAADLLTLAYNTPTSQAKNVMYKGKPVDLTNPDTYMYKGGNIDYAALDKEASGPLKTVYTAESPNDPRNVQTKQIPYQYRSDPAAYKNAVMGKLSTNLGTRDAEYQLTKLQQEAPGEFDRVNAAYKALTPQDWMQRYGKPEPQNLEPANPNNPADVWSSYLAKKRAVDVVPIPGKPNLVLNKANDELNKFNFWKRKQAIDLGDAKEKIKFADDYRRASAETQTAINEGWIDSDYQKALNPQTGTSRIGPDGQTEYISNTVSAPTVGVFTSGTGANKTYADDVAYNKDGTQMRPIYYIRDSKTHQKIPDGKGSYKEDASKTGWVSTESVKPLLGKEFKGLAQPAAHTTIKEQYPTDTNPANWKDMGNGTYRYKDGSVWDATGKQIR